MRKIIVISTYGDEPTGEKLKKCIARLEVRRLLADWVKPGISVRRRRIADIDLSALPREYVKRPRFRPACYQHHIEPKIVPFTAANSQWQRYLEASF
jgi:hypothetical protein